MTVQFIFGHEVVKMNTVLLHHVRNLFFFLTARVQHQQVILAGQPGVLCQMKAGALQSALGSSSKPPPQPSHFSLPTLSGSVLPPGHLTSPFFPNYSLLPSLSELANQLPSSPLNWQWCCLHYGCISPFQELPVSLLHRPCQSYHPMCPDLPQPNPALCHCTGKLLHSIF